MEGRLNVFQAAVVAAPVGNAGYRCVHPIVHGVDLITVFGFATRMHRDVLVDIRDLNPTCVLARTTVVALKRARVEVEPGAVQTALENT